MHELVELFVEESRPAHWDHPLDLLTNVDVAGRQAAQIIRALPRSYSLAFHFTPHIGRVVSQTLDPHLRLLLIDLERAASQTRLDIRQNSGQVVL